MKLTRTVGEALLFLDLLAELSVGSLFGVGLPVKHCEKKGEVGCMDYDRRDSYFLCWRGTLAAAQSKYWGGQGNADTELHQLHSRNSRLCSEAEAEDGHGVIGVHDGVHAGVQADEEEHDGCL